MKSIFFYILIMFSTACYNTLSIDTFDKQKWISAKNNCSTYRLEMVDLILENKELLLKKSQNDIESLLGKAKEHELYNRNQKFFHYRITPPIGCRNYDTVRYLSIRFNAIGRVNLIQMMLREIQ